MLLSPELHAPNETTVQNKLMGIKTKLLERAEAGEDVGDLLRQVEELLARRHAVS